MPKAWVAWAFAYFSLLVAGAAHAQQPVLNVQIINVCADDGSNCALSSPYAGYAYNPVITQRIYDQAGVAVNLLAPINYNNSAYLNPAIIDDPAHGYTTGSPTDPAHQLINLPGHYQSTVPNVLDLWFVNTLPHVQADGSSAPPLFGVALLNSNGAIVTTGDNGSGFIAGPDTLGHEVGHNLGLTHTNGPPLQGLTVADGSGVTTPAPPGTYPNEVPINTSANLLDGSGRLVPLNPCAVATPTCSGVTPPAGKDQLLPFQTAQIASEVANLFNVNGVNATASLVQPDASGSACSSDFAECTIRVSLTGPPGNNDSLVELDARFPYLLSPFTRTTLGGGLQCSSSGVPISLPGGGSEIAISFAPGCFTPGNTEFISLLNGMFQGGPFSFQFVFADGLTSLAAFDSTGTADSSLPIALSIAGADPTGPGLFVPTDPAQFNATSIAEDDSTVPVPEPASILLFAAGLMLSGLVAGRQRIRLVSMLR